MNELQTITEQIGWQDVLVWAAILLAVTYLFRKRILPKIRREQVGCEKCAAYQAITERKGVTVKKLTPEESKKLRSELND